MGTDHHAALPADLGSNLHRIQREREAEQWAANVAAVLSHPEIRAAQLDALFLSPAQAVAFVGPDGAFWEANAAFCGLLGYSRRELIGRTWQSLTHPDDRAGGEDEAAATVRGDQPAHSVVRHYLPKAGPPLLCSVRVTRVADRGGGCVHLVEQATPLPDRRDPDRADRRGGATLGLAHRHWLAFAIGLAVLAAFVWLVVRTEVQQARIDTLTERNLYLLGKLEKGESP